MSPSVSESMEQILDRFDDAWNGPAPPSIEDYLRACEPSKRLALLVELIQIDLERRLTSGERVRVEEKYLRRFPDLNAEGTAVVALAAREFELRRRREPDLTPAEFLERWPQCRDELAQLLQTGSTLHSASGNTMPTPPPAAPRQDADALRDVFALLMPSQAPDEIGRLGGYRVLKLLGTGGMGVVFHAEDAQLKRPVALKIMRPTMATDDTARQRFVREARAMAALKDERVVTIYQVGEDRGVPFLAMEYLEGESLEERLKREDKLPLAEALRIGREIALGLAAAHKRGLIHRDIKPSNVWLEAESGGVKILDFGLVRSIMANANLTQSGAIIGTPAYMAPEQASGATADPRCDLFSLGAVLYRMTTGQLPFRGRDAMSILYSLATERPRPSREWNPQLPPALDNLLLRLLAKNVPDRPSSALALIKAIESIEEEWKRPIPAVAVVAAPAPPTVVANGWRQPADAGRSLRPRRRLALAALMLLGMAALLAGIVIRIRGKDGRETTIEVPEGSKVTIEQEGKVMVFPADAPNPSRGRQGAVPPLIDGTEPLSPWALVRWPARIKGVRSWTIDTRSLRGGSISVAMRPDGRQLAVSSFDGVIRLYDPNTGRLQQVLFGQAKGRVNNLTWSPDGKHLASCYWDATLHIWNAATGQIIHTIHPSGTGGGALAWSPDGKLLAASTDAAVMLWDTESWQQVPFPVQAPNVWSLAWSPDSKMLAAGSMSPQVVWLWEAPSSKLLHKFEGFKGTVTALTFSPNGNTLIAGGDGEKVCRLWDAHPGKLLRTLELSGGASTAAFSPDGKILAVGTGDPCCVQLFETESWKPLRQLWPGAMGHIRSLAWSPDGITLATASYQGHVSIFDANTGKEVRRIESHPRMDYFAWSSEGKKIASSQHDVQVWDADSGKQLHRIEGFTGGLSWSPRGTSLAVLGGGQVHILDGDSGQRLRSWVASVNTAVPLIWSPDGKQLATVAEKTVQVWAAASGRLIHTLQGHTAGVGTIAWSRDGKTIASGSGDRTVRLWDATSGKPIHSFDAGGSYALSWSPDGKSLASNEYETNVRVWDMATKEIQLRCLGIFVGWSADSAAVITRDNGTGLVRWWDRQTGDRLRETKSDLLPSFSIARPDGRFAACVEGGALKIWEIDRGRTSLTLVSLRGGQWLAVRPDGHYRGSLGVEKELVYVVQTDAGQEVLAPAEFEKKYGWKNDPQRVRLPRK